MNCETYYDFFAKYEKKNQKLDLILFTDLKNFQNKNNDQIKKPINVLLFFYKHDKQSYLEFIPFVLKKILNLEFGIGLLKLNHNIIYDMSNFVDKFFSYHLLDIDKHIENIKNVLTFFLYGKISDFSINHCIYSLELYKKNVKTLDHYQKKYILEFAIFDIIETLIPPKSTYNLYDSIIIPNDFCRFGRLDGMTFLINNDYKINSGKDIALETNNYKCYDVVIKYINKLK